MKRHLRYICPKRYTLCIMNYALCMMFCLSCVNEDGLERMSAQEELTGTIEVALKTPGTRAATTTITEEEAKKFLVTLYKGADVYRERTTLGEMSKSLPAGQGYSMKAESCTEEIAESANDNWGQKRYLGISKTFGITAGQVTKVPIECSVANAGLTVIFDESITGFFKNYTLITSESDRSLVFDALHSGADMTAYYNIDGSGKRTITYRIVASDPVTLDSGERTLDLSAKGNSKITITYYQGTYNLKLETEEFQYEDMNINVDPDAPAEDDGQTTTNVTHEEYKKDNTTIEIDDYDKK